MPPKGKGQKKTIQPDPRQGNLNSFLRLAPAQVPAQAPAQAPAQVPAPSRQRSRSPPLRVNDLSTFFNNNPQHNRDPGYQRAVVINNFIVKQLGMIEDRTNFNYLVNEGQGSFKQCESALGCNRSELPKELPANKYCKYCFICGYQLFKNNNYTSDKCKPECEHVLPVYSGAAFIGLYGGNFQLNEKSKNNYGWVHNSCNSIKTNLGTNRIGGIPSLFVNNNKLTDIWSFLIRPTLTSPWKYEKEDTENIQRVARTQLSSHCIINNNNKIDLLIDQKMYEILQILNSNEVIGNLNGSFLVNDILNKIKKETYNLTTVFINYIIGLYQLALYHTWTEYQGDLDKICEYNNFRICVQYALQPPSSSFGKKRRLRFGNYGYVSKQQADRAFGHLIQLPQIFIKVAHGNRSKAEIIGNYFIKNVNKIIYSNSSSNSLKTSSNVTPTTSGSSSPKSISPSRSPPGSPPRLLLKNGFGKSILTKQKVQNDITFLKKINFISKRKTKFGGMIFSRLNSNTGGNSNLYTRRTGRTSPRLLASSIFSLDRPIDPEVERQWQEERNRRVLQARLRQRRIELAEQMELQNQVVSRRKVIPWRNRKSRN